MTDNRNKRFRRGQWRVQRERHQIAHSTPPPDFGDSKEIHDLIPALMKRLGLNEQHWQNEIQDEWPHIVGPDVANHSRPGRYAHGILYVFVDSSVWLHELKRYAGKRIVAAIQQRFGKRVVRQVRFVPDPEHGRSPFKP